MTAEGAPLCQGISTRSWSASHEQMRANDALWESLAFDGIEHDGNGGLFEHRLCPSCSSQLRRPISLETAAKRCEQNRNRQARASQATQAAVYVAFLGLVGMSVNAPSVNGWKTLLESSAPFATLREDSPIRFFLSNVQSHDGSATDRTEASPSTPIGDGWPTMSTEFGAALRQAREELMLTRAEFSKLSGVADSTIRNVETTRHRCTRPIRIKLVRALATHGYESALRLARPR